MARFCTGCGAPLSDDKKFCTECGTPVTEAAAEVMAEDTVAIVPEAGPEISAEAVVVTEAEPIQPVEAPKPQPQPQVSYQQPQAKAAYQQPQPQAAYQQTQQSQYQQAQSQAAYQQQATYQQPRQQAAYAQPVQARAVQAPPVYGADVPPAKGSKYEPITAWGYIGIMLLMCIPIVGIILTIVWACGGCRKVNKKSLARATLIMMAVGLVISLILGFVFKAIFNKAMEASGMDALMKDSKTSVFDSGKDADDEEGLAGLLGSLGALSGDGSTNNSENSGGNGDYSGGSDFSVNSGMESSGGSSDTSDMEALGALAALFGGLSGSGSENSEALGDLAALSQLFAVAGAIEGENGEVDLEAFLSAAENGDGDLESLLSGVEQANQDAEKLNDGWPKSLRAYPDGTATALASYRTEISGTSKETMHQWIEDLKKDGFEYQDFYDFGMTETDMLGMDAWWGYDGKTYLSVSYYDGVVTIDHTKELPDLESYFGG